MAEIGSIIDGKYEILTELGHGGMSVVYLAMDRRLKKQWAVKEAKKPAARKKAEPAVLKGSDEKLLEALFKQKNGRILQALYNGEDAWTGDRSRDDLYFCWNVNFRNGNDLAQTDRIFRASGRMRDKWDEVHWSDGTTYGQRTLARSYNKR